MTDQDQLAGWQGPLQPLMLKSSSAPQSPLYGKDIHSLWSSFPSWLTSIGKYK